ncbi:hypothetical protein [Enterovibrio norvegicus]|nr:hypothetical protein [Enterovibrio norvegicus]
MVCIESKNPDLVSIGEPIQSLNGLSMCFSLAGKAIAGKTTAGERFFMLY